MVPAKPRPGNFQQSLYILTAKVSVQRNLCADNFTPKPWTILDGTGSDAPVLNSSRGSGEEGISIWDELGPDWENNGRYRGVVRGSMGLCPFFSSSLLLSSLELSDTHVY